MGGVGSLAASQGAGELYGEALPHSPTRSFSPASLHPPTAEFHYSNRYLVRLSEERKLLWVATYLRGSSS